MEDQAASSELGGAFRDLEMFTSGTTQMQDEIEILRSRTNMIEVIRKLGVNLQIIGLGRIHDSELYKESAPFTINFLIPDSLLYLAKGNFKIKIISETSFTFKEQDDVPERTYSFGNRVSSKTGDFIIIPTDEDIRNDVGNEFKVILNPLISVAQRYKNKLEVTVTSNLSNVISLSMNDAVEQKAMDIINGLIDTYNSNAVEDKRRIAEKTSEFINDRIQEIFSNLSNVDQSAQEFKAGRGITDVASQANTNINLSAQSQQELQDAQIQLSIATSMKDIVDNQRDYEILPSNVGLTDQTITGTTVTYNQLVSERKRLLRSSNEKNPVIISLDEQLNGLKKSLQSSLNSVANNLNIQVNNLSSRLSQVNARIYATPGNERALRVITRQQQTTEALYLYLLQKREESQISFASASPKSNVIDRAYWCKCISSFS